MMGQFTNVNRNRYYGKRIGDIVSSETYCFKKAKVVGFGFMDNNAIIVKVGNQKPRKVVAEWCDIVTKVEDVK